MSTKTSCDCPTLTNSLLVLENIYYLSIKSMVFSGRLEVGSDNVAVTSRGKLFQTLAPATADARSPIVQSRINGKSRSPGPPEDIFPPEIPPWGRTFSPLVKYYTACDKLVIKLYELNFKWPTYFVAMYNFCLK